MGRNLRTCSIAFSFRLLFSIPSLPPLTLTPPPLSLSLSLSLSFFTSLLSLFYKCNVHVIIRQFPLHLKQCVFFFFNLPPPLPPPLCTYFSPSLFLYFFISLYKIIPPFPLCSHQISLSLSLTHTRSLTLFLSLCLHIFPCRDEMEGGSKTLIWRLSGQQSSSGWLQATVPYSRAATV